MSTTSTMSTITPAGTISTMSTIFEITIHLRFQSNFWDLKAFFEISKYFLRSQYIFWDPKTIFEIPKQPWDLKPLDLDALLGLKDLEIAQLAHHLRPIFGLVFISPPLLPLYGYVTLPFRKEVVILSYFPCDSRNFTFHTKHSNPQEICGKLENPPALGILTSFWMIVTI